MRVQQVVVNTLQHSGDSSGFSEKLALTPLSDGCTAQLTLQSSTKRFVLEIGFPQPPAANWNWALRKWLGNPRSISWIGAFQRSRPNQQTFQPLLKKVQDAGGIWGLVFSRMLFVPLSQDSTLDMKQEYER
jgi:hypothetical protein